MGEGGSEPACAEASEDRPACAEASEDRRSELGDDFLSLTMSVTRILIHNESSPIALRQLTKGHSKNKPCIVQNVMGS